MNRRVQLAFPYLFLLGMTAIVLAVVVTRDAAHRFQDSSEVSSAVVKLSGGADRAGQGLDPVCRMEVNPSWGFGAVHDGTQFYFCAKRCRQLFQASPEDYLASKCIVCQERVSLAGGLEVTYMDQPHQVCSAEHRQQFKADPAAFFLHRMWGIPSWLYYLSIAVILLMSFLMFERKTPGSSTGCGEATCGGGPSGPRYDLMQWPWLATLLRSRKFRFLAQLSIVIAFLTVLAAGLFGDQNPARNIAPLLTWTIWWCGLVVLIMYAGKAWCYVCPWDAIAGWMERLHFWKKSGEEMGLGLPWPRVLRNVGLATVLFVGLTWIEIGFGVTMKPWATAVLGLGMLMMAIVSAFLFEKRSFCRYACLVGRVSGLYAMFSSVEIRSRDESTCASCHTKECIRGSDTAYGCPTFVYPGKMETNTYCIQCTECLQSCPEDNLAVNLRPWGTDLAVEGRPRSDEAYLALLMLAISGFHGLTMTPVWGELTSALEAWLPGGPTMAFSVGMTLLMVLPVLIYTALVRISYGIAAYLDPETRASFTFHDYFVRYAYCVLPIALFYHLAHNLEHLLIEGPKILILMSDPFGWGWNLFGTAGWRFPPIVSLDVLWLLQVILVGVGHIYSLWAASKITRRIFKKESVATASQWPLLIGMILFSIFSLWLLKQPMEMRSSVM